MTKISIITINYNNALGLQKTIKSVVEQTFQEFEWVVIDGLSSDNSVEIIKQTSRINYWQSQNDKGIYDAQNKGIANATGEYFLFLNSGDELAASNVLEKVNACLSDKKSFYYGNLILQKNNVAEEHIAPASIDLDFMLNSTFWHPCIFINANLFKQYGLYNPQLKIAGDYEFFIRCLSKPDITTQHIHEFITRFDGGGISNDPAQAQLMQHERELAWRLNVSETVYQSLKAHNAFTRSKYSQVINRVQSIRGRKNF